MWGTRRTKEKALGLNGLEFRDGVAVAVRYPDVSAIKSHAIDGESPHSKRFRAWTYALFGDTQLGHGVAPGIRHPNTDSVEAYAVGQDPYGKRAEGCAVPDAKLGDG